MQAEERLRRALRRLASRQRRRPPVPRPQPDSEWGWAVEDRLARLEEQQRWLMRLVAGTLVVALVQLALKALGGG
ncbi:MAG: hypothetical protein C4311_06395 [Chloroflexota bacterium]